MTVSFPRMPMPTPFETLDSGSMPRGPTGMDPANMDQTAMETTMGPPEWSADLPTLGGMDDHLRLLDILFAEAEALTHGNHGKVMPPVDRKRLEILTREIDGLLDRAEGMTTPMARRGPLDKAVPDWDIRRVLDRREDLETLVPGEEDAYERLPAFEEPTIDEVLIAYGSRAVATRVHPMDVLNLARLDGPLTLDVENALDRITAQLDLSMAMNLPPTEVFSPMVVWRLAPPDAARIDAVLACMDRILAANPDHFLTGAAQLELVALMSEADRILGIGEEKALPQPEARRDGDAWRRSMDLLGRHVAALIPGSRVLPA
ncbi:MAG: hypothetical protein K9H25_07785 [Rhodospirillum sp.]|nr:hypothetical protein [Rhodospirillum sp.]MCF8489757.1 hypothetical protein [Rhodospirillum sp.]MCF8502467.1 hypothetical protein [Rhodospirillum sp.]